MKRINRRASSVLLLAFFIIGGITVLLIKLNIYGASWATYNANSNVYTSGGVLRCGTLTDRNGTVLATADEGNYKYADDAILRMASLHAVGDYRGYIGTSALTAFATKLTGYSGIRGVSGEGETVRLSLDGELQKAAFYALGGRAGTVMIMDYNTGEILCMVSSPTYDPYEAPDESIDGLYLNRGLSAAYTPGSVFKLITLCAALEQIPDISERSFYCGGSTFVEGVEINCTSVHGWQKIDAALANSCNCAFAEISLELGGDTICAYAGKYGIRGNLKLDSISTASGSIESAPSGSSYLAWSGIGQYTDLVTPYAMLRFSAAIANGGTVREPTLLYKGQNGNTKLINAETAKTVSAYMRNNILHYYGADIIQGLRISAKTGTAELGDETSHAWFTGFTEGELSLAFVVVLERGGSGLGAAAPVATSVLQKAMEIYK